jgi:hypothetical protein
MGSYKDSYSEDIVKKLDKIKYMLYSVGSIDSNVDIDFDIDVSQFTNEVVTLSIYVSDNIVIDGLVEDFIEVFTDINNKMYKIFQKIKLDTNLNFDRTYTNDYGGGMVNYLNYNIEDGNLEYNIHFLLEI